MPATSPETAPDTVVPGVPEAPDGDEFYQPPDPLPDGKAGDVIWARDLSESPAGSVGWEVLYLSESVQGDPIAVSGVVLAPTDLEADAPVVTWAHGTTGIADQCAPSYSYENGTAFELSLVAGALDRGWVFVATDYEGLGTPGVHPYLVGLSEGRGTLDIVRAAQQLTSSVTPASPVMIFGHSQGGGAALFAAEEAGTYAPDLNVVGTAAGAPAGDLDLIAAGTVNPNAAASFGLMMLTGFHAAYPDLPLDAVVNDAGAAYLEDTVETSCYPPPGDPVALGTKSPLDDPAWAKAIEENTAGNVVPSAPVLMYHGDADTTVPPILSTVTLGKYCAVGATVELKTYAGADHGSVIPAALPDIVAFFEARLAGEPAATSC